MKTLYRALGLFGLMVLLSAFSFGACQDQKCKRPAAATGCYTCEAGAGNFCSPVPNPDGSGCPKACLEGVCQKPAGGGGGVSELPADDTTGMLGGCDPLVDLSCAVLAARVTPEFQLKPQPLFGEVQTAVNLPQLGCQTASLPNNLLFRL